MVKNYLFILFLGLAAMLAQDVSAVTAVPWPVDKTQPDGTAISVYLRGDEKVHWMESLDGYTLMYDAQKYVVYARLDADGNLAPTNVRYGADTAAPANSPKGLHYSPAQVDALKQIWEVTSEPNLRSDQGALRASTTGARQALCVLMGFSDRPFAIPNASFETLFNQVGLYPADNSVKGSVRDFFSENSYGQLDFTVTLAGPYQAPNTTAYYANHEQEFAELTARAADADVDFNDFADAGRLETFHILFAGHGDESIGNGQQIWSHKWELALPIYLDGVRVSVYSCSPELRGSSGNNMTYIGVICHELSHVFGAPDYYDIDYSGFDGTGSWDLMANGSWNDGGRQPAHINMLQKIIYGWVNPIELTTIAEITDMPASAAEPVAYIVKVNANGEQYILDNRQPVGFDTSLPGHGLLIWHAHQLALNGNGSNDGHPQQFYPVVASSTTQIPNGTPASYGAINSGGTPFPGTTNKSAFGHTTTPAMFTWQGLQTVAKPITEITENTADKTISFKFMDGPAPDPVTSLTATVTVNDVKLDWTAPARDDIKGYKIFRDGTLIYSTTNKDLTTYTQVSVPNGTYEYCVSVVFEVNESELVCANATITEGSDGAYFPISNLQASGGVNSVNLNWTAPFTGGWTGIAGDYTTVYTFGEPWDFFAGTLWNPSDLAGLGGFDVTKVKFVPVETIASGASYSVVIYEVPTSGAPVEVYSQAVTSGLSYGAYNEITLTTPLTIDASKGIIIGVQIHTEGGNCLAVSQGDAYPGRNIFYDVDGWYPLEDIGVTLGRNFCLQVYLDADSSSPVILPNPVAPANTSFLKKDGGKQLSAGTQIASGINQAPAAVTLYKIYRDGVQVGTSTTTSYTDAGLTPATAYSYCVSVEYSGGGLSESVCVEVSTQNPYKPVTNLKAEVVIDEVKLTWKPQFSYNTIFAEDFESGIPASWGNVDVDGDGYIWSIAAAPSTTPQSGDKVAYSASYDNDTWEALTPNNWLVTPAITLTDDNVLRYYVSAQDASYAADKYGVYISTDNAVPGTFVSLFEETMTASPGIPVSSPATGAFRSSGPQYAQGTWYERTVDLSAYAGQTVYIAFRHFDCTDQFLVNLDNVQILEPINFGVMTFAVSEEGTTIATGLTNPEYTLTGVTVDTHNYCVTAIYDGIVESEAVCVEAIVISPYRPVTNLEAQVEEDDINLNWGIPEAIAYNTVFEEDFESGIPATWTNVDEDGDGFTWYESLYATPQSGNGSVSSDSYDLIGFTGPLTPDNWLITPAITLSGKNRLSYYISTLETTWPAEKYGVYISTTTTALDQFTELFNETMSGSPAIPVVSSAQKVSYARSAQYVEGTWLERAIDLSAYEGQTVYIAFRHYDCYDQFSLNLDNVKIQESIYIGDITYNVYEDDVLAASGLTTTQYALTDKVPGTYNYCVTAVYDNVNESESVCVEATVLSPYRPVTNLKAQVVVTDVNLKWGEPQSLTNNVVFEEDFESGIPASWSNVDEDGDGYLWSIYSPPVTLSGTQVATSASYQGGVLTPNNWLITPAITLTDGNVLKYYVNAQDDQYPREKYGVYISTDNTIPGTFVSLFEETMTASPGIPVSSPATGAFRSSGPQYVQGAWYERTIDLSAYNGQTVYIAFRHFDSRDEFRLNLDNVQILEPSSMGDITYNVYEEGTLLASGLTEKQYTVTDVTAGTHNYCVTAVYDNVNESESVCVEATVLNPYRPVHNLNATWTEPFKSELNWDVPVFAQTLRHHTFSSGSFSTVNVTGSNIDIDAAARWTPEDLEGTGADEFMLTKVRFLPVAAKSVVSYSIRIWVGGSNPSAGVYDPGTLIVDQPIPAHTPLTWSEIVLDTPVAIDPTQEIWIGLRCVLPSGGYTAPLQPSNTLAGKGNLIRWNGTWMELTDVNSSIAGNWIIDGILGYQGANAPAQLPALNDDAAQTSGLTLSAVEEALTAAPFVEQAPTLPTVVKYIVTRDGEELGETTATTFADETTVDKTSYTYCVQAVYDDEGISSPACTDFVKTDAQILEEVKIVIEATTNSFYQSTANDESQVANWLVGRLKNINLPSEIDITAGDISFNAFTAAIEGTESVPDGIDGSFDFTVSLTLPEAANTATGSGTILALGYTPPAPEEVYYNLDIPSVEGVSIDWSPGTHSVGDRENITITFAALEGYLLDGMNVYANGTVQSLTLNNGLYVLSLGYLSEDVSITVDGVRKIDDVGALSPSGADLKAMKVDGGLYVYGLKPGADFRVYNISGTLVYQGKAVATEQFVTLHERGFYIVVSEGVSVKIAL